nr:WYL domain-containing protein [Sphingomonas sp. CDS-1]
MSSLWTEVRGKFVAARAILTDFVVPDEDDQPASGPEDGLPAWQENLISVSGLPFVLTYQASKGEVTQRLVTCQRLDRAADTLYLWAFCHHRAAVRQFRVDRITDIADAATGELLGSPLAFFAQFEIDRSQRSKPGWGLNVRQRADFVAVLNALMFMARCDREYHPLERQALEDCITRYWLRFEAPGDPDMEAILNHADRLAPDAETFFVSLNRCAAEPRLVRLLKESAAEIIDADGVHAPHEVYWGSKIDEFFKNQG